MDRGIQSFLAGSFDDAAATVRLWSDLGGPQTTMAVPGLDELAFISAGRTTTEASIEPPEIALAQRLRVRVATAGDGRWRAESDEVRDIARTLTSPFARARVETMLGTQHAIRDDHSSARIHLQYAERLFELSGATAWARAVRGRLDRLDAREGASSPRSALSPRAARPGRLSSRRASWRWRCARSAVRRTARSAKP